MGRAGFVSSVDPMLVLELGEIAEYARHAFRRTAIYGRPVLLQIHIVERGSGKTMRG